MEAGLIEVIRGVGFSRVTALAAVFVESAASVAVIVMTFELGGNSGAVKRPLVVIVPVAAFPPTTPFTLQATVGNVASPVTWALNCWVSVPRIIALPGLTTSWPGAGGGVLLLLPTP